MRGRTITLASVVALAVLAGAGVGLFQLSRARCVSLVAPPICRVHTTAPLVALTFDDGPTALGLQAILPELARHEAHATFFLIGGEAEAHPDMVRSLLAAGQEVGNHTYSHLRNVGHSQAFYEAEIARTQAALRAAGAYARFVRPPYGKKLIGLPLAIRRAGLTMVTWDVEDPSTDDPRRFAAEVVRQAHPGAIILIHAMYSPNGTARAALPMILDGLEARRLRVVTVSDLLAREAPGAVFRPQRAQRSP
jgi:peptidoglycan/xylan/chitin deacetylase (PgdA/CDA1 family)